MYNYLHINIEDTPELLGYELTPSMKLHVEKRLKNRHITTNKQELFRLYNQSDFHTKVYLYNFMYQNNIIHPKFSKWMAIWEKLYEELSFQTNEPLSDDVKMLIERTCDQPEKVIGEGILPEKWCKKITDLAEKINELKEKEER